LRGRQKSGEYRRSSGDLCRAGEEIVSEPNDIEGMQRLVKAGWHKAKLGEKMTRKVI
jgi:hypothetical protein